MTKTTPFREVVERLRALHDLDLRILRHEREIREGPAKLSDFQAQVGGIDERVSAVEDRMRVLRAQVKLRENELKTVEQKIERVKAQASLVRTNKEFMAYRAELANFQADADRLQGEILKILEVVEQAEQKVSGLMSERGRAHDKVKGAQEALEASLDDVKKERDALIAERPARRAGIPKAALEVYERVRASRGSALAVIDGEYCSACMERQTRNDILAVQNATRLVPCRACNRILVAEL